MVPFHGYVPLGAITKSDSALISLRGIYVGGTGDIAIKNVLGGTTITFTALPVGAILPIVLEQGLVMSTGTTATLMVALG